MDYRLIKVVDINTIGNNDTGYLSFFEKGNLISFDIKRIYYISKCKKGQKRGFHAHKHLKQFIFCPYGEIKLEFDDGLGHKETITLDSPNMGVLILKPVWRTMIWKKTNSVLAVACSMIYSEDDYIRDYNSFLKYVEKGDKEL